MIHFIFFPFGCNLVYSLGVFVIILDNGVPLYASLY